MNIVTALLTNGAYGYPKGAARRRRATVLACLHQTATATAMQERNYANRAHSTGPSATAYIDRDGTIVRAIDPVAYAAWSQGDVDHPDLTIPTVKAAVASGVNMNERVHESLEVCGRGAEPFSTQQFEAVAGLIAAASKATGIKVSRSTVIAHRDVNTVNRPSDPWPAATREARLKRVIDRANAILDPPPAIVDHVVVAGDTLGEIATAHGLTLAKLLAFPQNATYRKNPALIHVGDVVRGESYKADRYEQAIGQAFEHVAVSARLKTDTVADATRPEPDGGDVLAVARIDRERDRAALRFARDRDLGGLEATMARLDAEAAAAVVRPPRIPTAAEARAYLEELPALWAKTSDAGRHAIAEATFERIDVLGVTDFTFKLTAHAKARGWDAAFGAGVVRVKEGQSGRGERIRASATRQIRGCQVTVGGQGQVDVSLTA